MKNLGKSLVVSAAWGMSSHLVLADATVKAILDFGGTIFNDANFNGNDNGSVGIKDAFIVVGGDHKTGFSFSAGAQPLARTTKYRAAQYRHPSTARHRR
jgi:hypothetical protein